MEVIIAALLVLFVILIITIGIENTFTILLPISFLGIAIYLLGWFIMYVLPAISILLFVIFIIGIIKKKARSSTYRKTKSSSSSNRTTYGRFNSREEVEEFFRTFFGGGFGQGTTGSDDDFFNSYRNSSNSGSTNRTYGDTFNSREEEEEFFRTFFGGVFGQGTTGTGGSTYGGGYSSQNGGSSYQRNTSNTYTTDKSKYYTILGVNRGASQDEIKKAYHKLAKEHHPDKFVNSSDSEKKYHENKMKEINDAYENLTK